MSHTGGNCGKHFEEECEIYQTFWKTNETFMKYFKYYA